MTRRSHGLANRPGEPYPATFRMSVDPPGIEPGFPPRQGGVVPLDHEPSVVSCLFQPVAIPHLQFILGPEPAFRVAHPAMGRTHRAADLSAPLSCGLSSSTHSGAPGNRTPITWVQAKRLPVGPAPHIVRGPSGNRTRSPSLPRTCAAGTLTDHVV